MTPRAPDQPGPVRLGILGGGQLARMIALAGIPLGFRFEFLDPSPDACAGATGRLHTAGFEDGAALDAFAAAIEIATFDFENVPATAARHLARLRPFRPDVAALEACQDRLAEKRMLADLGIAVPDHASVDSRAALLAAAERLGFPCVLKTRRLGYDGKGQAVLRQPEDLERAWQRLGGEGLVLEEFVPFEAECSQLSVRARDGSIRHWPLTRNLHVDSILLLSRPGVFSASLERQARETAANLLGHFDYVGVMAIEFFLHEGQLLANEIAPRVHNSGHWTIEGAVTSQFENHVRAIAGLPLGDTAQVHECVMFNWIGDLPERDRLLAVPGLHWHEYGKQPRARRKIGHATLTAADETALLAACGQLAGLLGGDWPRYLESLGVAAPSS